MAYGILKLKPWELDKLTIMEFNDMYYAYEEAKTNERWEQAYWVATMMSVHTKHSVKPKRLMEPFLKQKSSARIADEREQFFRDFEEQRKEAGKWVENQK